MVRMPGRAEDGKGAVNELDQVGADSLVDHHQVGHGGGTPESVLVGHAGVEEELADDDDGAVEGKGLDAVYVAGIGAAVQQDIGKYLATDFGWEREEGWWLGCHCRGY